MRERLAPRSLPALSRRRFALTLPAAALCAGALAAPALPILRPADFGARGDGQTDDSEALQRLFDRAAEQQAEVVLPDGRYVVSRYLIVRDGVRRITGAGGVILFTGDRENVGLLLAGVAQGLARNVHDCEIQGLVLDARHRAKPVNALHGCNAVGCRFVGNRIVNLKAGTGVLIQSFAAGREPAADNLIADNVIEGVAGEAHVEWWGIRLNAELRFPGPEKTQNAYWKAHFAATDAALPVARCTVRNNQVDGGYYGVWLTAARDCVVSDNTFARNTRSISIQDCSARNQVRNNRCDESLSSAIHLAYGSRGNRIEGNRVTTLRGEGEGLLQAYVGTEDNLFVDNEVHSLGRSRYLIYCGVQALRNEFRGNRLHGNASHAHVALESAWDWTILNPAHYGYLKLPASVSGFARNPTVDNRFIDNLIDGEGEAPALFLAQMGSASTGLIGTRLERNQVMRDRHRAQLELVEQTAGALRNTVAIGNRFASDRDSAFILPRGAGHFAQAQDNGPLDARVLRPSEPGP
jgi:parallel beta-helix repeat protein